MKKTFDPLALSEFARHYGFHYDRIDLSVLMKDVLEEMDKGLNGADSSLPMIPAYLSPVSKITPGKTVIALDAGGTNLRAALVKFDDNGKAVTEEVIKTQMPGTAGRLDAQAFFDGFADVTVPLIKAAKDKIEGIGFCFSYNMDITKDTDGILRAFSKEIDAPEVLGMAIGKGLREALLRRNVKVPERILLLNDTVAALLSGLSELPTLGNEAGPTVGFILGTGFNTAYAEKCIPKIGFNSPENPQIMVCESGNYSHKYMGKLDREFDSMTKTPGTYTLEKTVSGAYLGPLSYHILCRAIQDGLVSFNRAEEFLSMSTIQTKDLNSFLYDPVSRPIGELFGKDERDAISSILYLCSIITERGSILSAAMLAAAAIKAGDGYDPLLPVRIAVEGTTYELYKGLRSALESYLHIIMNRDKPRSYVITLVEQASLLGAAVAALSG